MPTILEDTKPKRYPLAKVVKTEKFQRQPPKPFQGNFAFKLLKSIKLVSSVQDIPSVVLINLQ